MDSMNELKIVAQAACAQAIATRDAISKIGNGGNMADKMWDAFISASESVRLAHSTLTRVLKQFPDEEPMTTMTDRIDEHTATEWTTWGPTRSQGHIYPERSTAIASLHLDREGCAYQGGYSDRQLAWVDRDGFLRAVGGEYLWPSHGRSTGAVKVVR